MTPDRLDLHKFWSQQPVSETENKIKEEVNEPVDKNCEKLEISQNSITLPPGFEWCSIDIRDPLILKEFFEFLEENYIEDSSATFKLEYSEGVIAWALIQSGYFPECIRCIRYKNTGKLIASIVATPDELNIGGKMIKVVFVDFLCIAKLFRSKRLSPVLIKEITRLSNLRGIFQALHTGAIVLPTCIASPVYYHRFLNPKKLVDSGFSSLPDNIKLSLYCKIHKTPTKLSTPGFREMKIGDVKQVTQLLNDYQKKFRLAKIFSEKFVHECLLPKKDIIYSYVVENDGVVTDFISFYTLRARSVLLKRNDCLKLAMLYYYSYTKTPLHQLIDDLIYSAKNENFDVFNILEIMDNKKLLTSQKFVLGSGTLRYYLFNWMCPGFTPEEIGVFVV